MFLRPYLKFKFLKKKLVAFFIIISFLGINGELLSNTKEENNQKNSNRLLNKNYLKNFPYNYYILGPGDVIEITSIAYPEINQVTTISGEGKIQLEKLKDVYVNKLSLNELNILLNEAYKEFIKYPDIEVRVINYRPIFISVFGAVENQGIHTLKGSFSSNVNAIDDQNFSNIKHFFPSIVDGIRAAGGLTRYSDLSKITLQRKETISNGGGVITKDINLSQLLITGDNSQNIRIYDDDKIFIDRLEKPNEDMLLQSITSGINKKFITVYVSGRVNRRGAISISRASSLNDAIYLAGGSKVIKGSIQLFRFGNTGKVERKIIRFSKTAKPGSKRNPFLKDYDSIYVDQNLFNIASEVITDISSPFSGLVTTYGLYKVFND